ncbi:porin [Aquisalimonas sp.]|uniref:porin n=1 Tax=Aquisalimonas sp. TaxID=1872621 RepID=UPI0025C26FF9|nr:porin [Aquisalimonas sp.]
MTDAPHIIEPRGRLLSRLEANTSKHWTGFLYQEVELVESDFSYEYQAYEFGGRVSAAGVRFTAAYTDTKGIGQLGLFGLGGVDAAEVDTDMWYVELDYTFGNTLVGVNYGEADQDATTTAVGSAPSGKNQMGMLFARYQLTPQLTLLGELQQASRTSKTTMTSSP